MANRTVRLGRPAGAKPPRVIKRFEHHRHFAFGDGGASDDQPNAYTFTDQTNASLSTSYESNAITVAGIDTAAALTITGGQYQINGGVWASSATTVVNGDSVKVRGTSSGSYEAAVNVALTIGGVSDTFTITTTHADRWLRADGSGGWKRADGSGYWLRAA